MITVLIKTNTRIDLKSPDSKSELFFYVVSERFGLVFKLFLATAKQLLQN
ncbi:protein of unknown function [Brochothrix thermosphacta]|nr:protein of unknown function [Brochothrix thermosphacta]